MPAESFAIRGRLLLGDQFEQATLIVEDGRIAGVHRDQLSDGNLPATVIEAEMATPGMIDLQVNGAIGLEVGDKHEEIDRISEWTATTGVTTWLPTVVTADLPWYERVFVAWPSIDPEAGATPLGLHLEGPFLSPARKGAHQIEFIEGANDEIFEAFLKPDFVTLVTLAPEREGNLARIKRLVDRGIVVSLGHTDATLAEFSAGVDAGATKATHLFNTMSPVHHRAPGAMVATMLDDRVTAGLIPDAIHSDPAMVRLALKTKGIDGIATVSDMMSACGLGPGEYPLGGKRVIVDGMRAHLADGTLAGSMLPMDLAVRNLVDWGGLTFAEAIITATRTPARVLHDRSRGQLVVGQRADLTLWDSALQVKQTFVGGKLKFTA